MASDGSLQYDVIMDSSNAQRSNISLNKTLIAVGASLAAVTAKALQTGRAFERSFAGVTTLFGDVAVNTDKLQDNIINLSNASGIAADELNEGLYAALSAGVPITEDGTEALEFLEQATRLSKAGFTDLDTAVTATASTLNAYGLETSEASKIQDILIATQNKGITTVEQLGSTLSGVTPTAAAMNLEFEQVGASLATITAAGTPTSQAVTQLNSVLAELGKTGTQANMAFQASIENTELAGTSFQELNAQGVPLSETLLLLQKHAEANNLSLLDMFSSVEAGKAALALTRNEGESFNNNLDAMFDSAGSVDEAFDKMSETIDERLNKAINTLNNSFINLFRKAIAPLIIGISDLITWFGEHENIAIILTGVLATLTLGIIAYKIQLALATAETVLWGSAGLIATTVTTAFGAAMTFLTSPITLVILAIGALVTAAILLVKNWDVAKVKLLAVWNIIKSSAFILRDRVVFAWQTMMFKIQSVIAELVEAAEPLISFLPESIQNSFTNASATIQQSLEETKAKMDETSGNIEENKQIIADSMNELKSTFDDFKNTTIENTDATKGLTDEAAKLQEKQQSMTSTTNNYTASVQNAAASQMVLADETRKTTQAIKEQEEALTSIQKFLGGRRAVDVSPSSLVSFYRAQAANRAFEAAGGQSANVRADEALRALTTGNSQARANPSVTSPFNNGNSGTNSRTVNIQNMNIENPVNATASELVDEMNVELGRII